MVRVSIPRNTFLTPKELEQNLQRSIIRGLKNLLHISSSSHDTNNDNDGDESKNDGKRLKRSSTTTPASTSSTLISKKKKDFDITPVPSEGVLGENEEVKEEEEVEVVEENEEVNDDASKIVATAAAAAAANTRTVTHGNDVRKPSTSVETKQTRGDSGSGSSLPINSSSIPTTTTTTTTKPVSHGNSRKPSGGYVKNQPPNVFGSSSSLSSSALTPSNIPRPVSDQTFKLLQQQNQQRKSKETKVSSSVNTISTSLSSSSSKNKSVTEEEVDSTLSSKKKKTSDDPSPSSSSLQLIFEKYPDLQDEWTNSKTRNFLRLFDLILTQDLKYGTVLYPEIRNSKALRKRLLLEIAEPGSRIFNLVAPTLDNYDVFFTMVSELDDTYDFNPNQYININRLAEEENTKKHALKTSLVDGIHFKFWPDISRFAVEIRHEQIRFIRLSSQINYILGFKPDEKIKDSSIASYTCDLRGGVSHIYCYIDGGIIDNVIVGNTLAPLLDVIAVTGNPGDTVQQMFQSPMYSKVVAREIDEIGIELRTIDGRLVPFDYGTVVVRLIFKKVIVF
jgi:hypothetical protein